MTDTYAEHLKAYFARQRWFGGKGREFSVVHVQALPWLSESDPRVRIEIVRVAYEDGSHDTYQFPVAYLAEPDADLAHALVGELDHEELGHVTAYDGVYLKPAADLLLAGFSQHAKYDSLSFEVVTDAQLPEDAPPGTVMTAEQSNTSIAFGEEALLKLFRRVSAGGNPDIEIHEALTRHGSEHVAPLLGWIGGEWEDLDGVPQRGHLGMLQQFLRTATDGWDLALASVRDLLVEEDLHPDEVGGDFAGEAERLGVATAEVHAALAELFETSTYTAEQLHQLAAAMNARLDHALTVVPQLEEHSGALREHFSRVAGFTPQVQIQRVHGDLHLGQTLRTVKGWKIIDFEGEPAKSLAERVALDSPLRDVAGMLRSFDYAAGSTLHSFGGGSQLSYRADEWGERNRSSFLDGYLSVAGGDLESQRPLLHAYEVDKAVYEAVYEARNRPGWLHIPLHAIERIAAGGHHGE